MTKYQRQNEPGNAFEEQLATDLAQLADTAVPGRRTDLDVAALAIAQRHALRWPFVMGAAAVVAGFAVAAVLAVPRQAGGLGARASASPISTALAYACGTFTFSPALLGEPAFDLKSNPAGFALAQFIDSGQGGEPVLPTDGWHVAAMDDSTAAFIAPLPGDPPYAEAQTRRTANGWHIEGWGQCRPSLQLRGVNAATWTIAPGQRIDSSTQSLMVDVTETACASGQSSASRLRTPIIAYEPDRVVVAFTV